MKKILSIVLLIALLISLTACGINISIGSGNNTEKKEESESPSSYSNSTSDDTSSTQQQTTVSDSYPKPESRYNSLEEIDFSAYKVIMVNYWRPTCGFCVAEMPDLEKIWQDYQNSGLLVVGVSTESADVENTIAETGVTYPIIIAEGKVDNEITNAMPQTAFYDREGNMLPAQSFEVENSDEIRDGFFIGSASYSVWSAYVENRLNGNVSPSGESIYSPISAQSVDNSSNYAAEQEYVNQECEVSYVTVENDVFDDIVEFYIKPSDSSDWGNNYISYGGSYDEGRVTEVGYIYHNGYYIYDIFFRTRNGMEASTTGLDFRDAEDMNYVTIGVRFNNGTYNAVVY